MIKYIFTTPKNYSECLNKIGLFTLGLNYALIWVFSETVFDITGAVINAYGLASSLSNAVPVWVFNLPIVEFIIASIIGIISRVVTLHVLIANLFGLLDSYMVKEILLPLAAQSKVGVREEKLEATSHDFHAEVFYKYLDKIDSHLVQMFWEKMQWHWILMEASFFLIVYSFIAAFFGNFIVAFWFSVMAIVSIICLTPLRRAAAKRTRAEISGILSDPNRSSDIDNEIAKL